MNSVDRIILVNCRPKFWAFARHLFGFVSKDGRSSSGKSGFYKRFWPAFILPPPFDRLFLPIALVSFSVFLSIISKDFNWRLILGHNSLRLSFRICIFRKFDLQNYLKYERKFCFQHIGIACSRFYMFMELRSIKFEEYSDFSFLITCFCQIS